ncbi:MAG: HlyD family secretion protein [Myxococcales bacterium]|nr:HlyD family secretion protein [Myxococcales bacterium]
MMDKTKKYLATGSIVLLAIVLALFKYWHYVVNPWTRDGQVRANVVQIAPRVSGPIVELPIANNQFVKAGDVLFQIDPRTFQVGLEQARAELANTSNNYEALSEQVVAAEASVDAARFAVQQAGAGIKEAESNLVKDRAEFKRQQEMLPRKATSQKAYQQAEASYRVSVQQRATAVAGVAQAKANLHKAEANLAEAKANRGAAGEKNPKIRAAVAELEQAELDLEFTTVRAPVDGYVTNLNLRQGSQMVADQPALALIDVHSYWVTGYFRENYIKDIQLGDRAVVTLMTYPDQPLTGRVESIGWGIAQEDGSTGFQLLPNVAPTFEWIRLAQRVPVLVELDQVPPDVALRVGTTCSVLVETGTADAQTRESPTAAPRALQ